MTTITVQARRIAAAAAAVVTATLGVAAITATPAVPPQQWTLTSDAVPADLINFDALNETLLGLGQLGVVAGEGLALFGYETEQLFSDIVTGLGGDWTNLFGTTVDGVTTGGWLDEVFQNTAALISGMDGSLDFTSGFLSIFGPDTTTLRSLCDVIDADGPLSAMWNIIDFDAFGAL